MTLRTKGMGIILASPRLEVRTSLNQCKSGTLPPYKSFVKKTVAQAGPLWDSFNLLIYYN